ncbi:zinc protease [Candidatus Magnetomoraceae bacterium gMMP-15]
MTGKTCRPFRWSYLINFIGILFILFCLISCINSFSSKAFVKTIDTGNCLSTEWPFEASNLRPDPDLNFGRLPNGFRYILMENHKPEDRVSMHLNVQAGSLHETDEQQGLAHYLEHMLFNGSTHFPPGELIKYFQSIGMDFGGDTNAHTGFNETVYDIFLPAGTKKSLEDALLVMEDYASGALLLNSEIERERGIILSEKRQRDSVKYRTYVAAMKFLFPDLRINKRMPIGTEEVIKKADHSLLKAYYDTWYRPENMVLVAVGDFNVSVAESLIKKSFSRLSARASRAACPVMESFKHKGIKAFYHYEKEAGKTEATIQSIWYTKPKPDSLANQKAILTQDIADAILQDRLNAVSERPDSPFTLASVSSGIFLDCLNYVDISAESDPKNWSDVLASIEKILRQALEFGFSESELDRVKKEYLAEIDAAILEKKTRNSEYLARLIIHSLNNNKVLQSPEQEKELYASFIESLTIKDIHENLVKTWNHNHRIIQVTGNASIKPDKGTAEAVIREVFDKSAKTTVLKPQPDKIVKFPYLPEPEKSGSILKQTELTDLNIQQIDFANGVRLNLKKTDFKKNKVIASVSFGFGSKTEPLPGLAFMTESVLNKSGLGQLTESEMDRALAGKKTSVSFDIDENSFSFEGRSISKELTLLFQLLYAHIKDSAYRKDAYTLTMKQLKQMHEKLSHTIEGAVQLSVNRFLAGGDYRFGMVPYEIIQKLSLDQVKSWIDPVIKQSPLEISVAGDFDPELALKLAAKYFGSLPGRKEIHDKKETLKFPEGRNLVVDVKTTIDKGMVIIAWPTEDFWNIHRKRGLSVLGQVLSDRLRQEIRENLGISYSLYAYNYSSQAYEDYGLLRSIVNIKPEMADKVIQEVRRISSELAEKGVMPDELKRAVKPILTAIKDMKKSNTYWLNTVLIDSLRYPQQLDWARSVQQDYASVTAQEISDLAKKYLINEKAATIIIKPNK